MRLGILDCDRLEPDLAARFGHAYSGMFITGFRALRPDLEMRVWDALAGDLPSDLGACDAWLITGSRHDAYSNEPWVVALRDWIVRAAAAQVPLAGICFGHQAIAQALGGRVNKSDKGWGLGVATHTVLAGQPWMVPARDRIRVLVSHQDQVEVLPPAAQRLAGNDFCPNFMFSLGGHILAIQGHPEFSLAYDAALIERRRERLGEVDYQAAMATLTQEVDSALVMRWFLQFLGLLPVPAAALA